MADRNQKLRGKVALITGAGNGIGKATALLFSELGATLSLLDMEPNCLKAVAEECEKRGRGQPKPAQFVGDVTQAAFRKKYVEDTVTQFGRIDILVNNAGTTKLTTLLDSPEEDYEKIFDVNVKSIVYLTQIAAPHLIKTKGSVISMSSVAGHRVVGGRLFYGMSKACVRSFTQYAAQELGQYQVRVNSISPGVITTDIILKYGISKEDLPKYFEQAIEKQALLRCGKPEEVSELIAFLASDEASFITGEDIIIDGGLTIQPSVNATIKRD